RRMRHDERAVAGGPSRAQCRRGGRARHVGDERAADHRTRATHVLPPRPSDPLAAVAADSCTRLGGALEVGDPPAHENCVAPADGDVGARRAWEQRALCAIIWNNARSGTNGTSMAATSGNETMSNIDAELARLIAPSRVHRRLYTDPAIFDLEMER